MPKFLITSGEAEEVITARNRDAAINRFVKNNSDKDLGVVVQGCEILGDLFYVLTEKAMPAKITEVIRVN
jgi:hypothetical protein